MKYIFLGALLILVIASILMKGMQPDAKSKVPVLYWSTDPNPARTTQIEVFQEWLKKTYSNEVDFVMKVDTVNSDNSKVVIQGVSGVGSDIIGHCGGPNMRFREAVGILEPVTDMAKQMGFGLDKTFPVLAPDLTVGGEQYAFPLNVTAPQLWVNVDVFKKYGMEAPPSRWSIEEFERIGKKLVEKANKDVTPDKRVFLVSYLAANILTRSKGVDEFNETLTASQADNPTYIGVLDLIYKWTEVDKILPNEADRQAFSTEAGYGGQAYQMFANGNYAMLNSGRYALIQLREFNDGKGLNLKVVEFPNGGFPNTSIGTRAAAVYKGGKHMNLTYYFMQYLASPEYNNTIIADADALPPNPEAMKTEEFLRPKDYPNEWGCHEAFANAANNIAIPAAFSPFVLDNTVGLERTRAEGEFKANRITAAEAAAKLQRRVNNEIQIFLKENPHLMPEYQKRLKIQEQIDQYKKEGKPLPDEWIYNPFYKKYYKEKGMIAE
ncbi:MAG: ABC transporter substrate-binding protein [Kiritimatiellae bacterium]|jgi:multiple sugar transport system substrate-binding protein|nr:ABC transporter substrate-binding protein [Kiritimatiellia bacterium]